MTPEQTKACSIDGCNRPAVKRGWCHMHYLRWYKRGDPGPAEPERVLATCVEDFLFRVQKIPGGCWLWLGEITPFGYGQMSMGGRNKRAHRYFYEQLVGPIPEGLQLDHLCRVRNCVNPEHLEAVSAAENIQRALPYRRVIEECKNGHPLAGANIYIRPSRPTRRECRACRRYWSARNRKRASRRTADSPEP